jgi:hypothetical protein
MLDRTTRVSTWSKSSGARDEQVAINLPASTEKKGRRALRVGRGIGHHAATRQLANRLVGILHGCLMTGTLYDENTAWQHRRAGADNLAA